MYHTRCHAKCWRGWVLVDRVWVRGVFAAQRAQGSQEPTAPLARDPAGREWWGRYQRHRPRHIPSACVFCIQHCIEVYLEGQFRKARSVLSRVWARKTSAVSIYAKGLAPPQSGGLYFQAEPWLWIHRLSARKKSVRRRKSRTLGVRQPTIRKCARCEHIQSANDFCHQFVVSPSSWKNFSKA